MKFPTTKPLVSICCVTYNHENYIKSALESFLFQETDFDYEILVHDDASTDSTPYILSEYANRYPNMIKVITQDENQYSKRPIIFPLFLLPEARGDYVALCEGDDYWTDTNKLQLQVQALIKNKKVNLCYHNTAVEIYRTQLLPQKGIYNKKMQYFDGKNIPSKKSDRIQTSSMLLRRSSLLTVPKVIWNIAPFGDLFIQAVSGREGALKLLGSMSVYRANVSGSFSNRIKTAPSKKIFKDLSKALLCSIILLVMRKIRIHQFFILVKRVTISYLSILLHK